MKPDTFEVNRVVFQCAFNDRLSFRDPMFLEYLDKIGQHFFGVPPPQRGPPPGGMLSGIFDSLLSGRVIFFPIPFFIQDGFAGTKGQVKRHLA